MSASSAAAEEAKVRADVRREVARAVEIGVRQTILASVAETFEEHFDRIASNEPTVPGLIEGVSQIRFRHQPTKVPAVDARWDAIGTIAEYILPRVSYPEFAYHFAVRCADYSAEDLKTGKTSIVDSGDYTLLDIPNFTSQVTEKMYELAEKIADKKVTMEEMAKIGDSFDVSAHSLKGRRQKQEDRFFVVSHVSSLIPGCQRKMAVAGIFDGHGGSEISSYSAAHFAGEFAAQVESENEGAAEKLLKDCFDGLETSLNKRIEKEKWTGGSTAVVCIVDEKNVLFGWIGDSSGYIVTHTRLVSHTELHRPDREEERERVEKAGGQIYYNDGIMRVNGVLSITRALGDLRARPAVISTPEYETVERKDDYLLAMVVSDGITDVFNRHELYQIIEAFVLEHKSYEYMDMASYICEQAVAHNAFDNVTCVIILLKTPEEVWDILSQISD